jgi:arylsulfatase A-like enzyme
MATESPKFRIALALAMMASASAPVTAEEPAPHVLIITVDTLRADRLGSHGYARDTSPNIDALLAGGVRFSQARTVEPLTTPGLTSMITALYPHNHGATRNGMRMREGLPSLTKVLKRRGYSTGAFVGNWTLNDDISGMGEHFDHFETVLTRSRWLFWAKEADAGDINSAALEWLESQRAEDPERRLFLWVHYVEPHGPYKSHPEFAAQLGLGSRAPSTRKERYDSEIAFVDARIGEFLKSVDEVLDGEERLTVFTSDHGESLGEHGYWGHGRHCYEAGLRIPLGLHWPGKIEPSVIDAPALNIDIPQTVLGLLGLPTLEGFEGLDWTPVLAGDEPPPTRRVGLFQSHRGAVHGQDNERARQRGLLEVAVVIEGRKEILRIDSGLRRIFEVTGDPSEQQNLVTDDSSVSVELSSWLERVQAGLAHSDELPAPVLSTGEIERLRALGYID